MGKMVRATLQQNEQELTLQVVFRKPDNPSQPPVLHSKTKEHHSMASGRTSPFSAQFDSDGTRVNERRSLCSSFCLEEYRRDKTRQKKTKPRPHSASATGKDQVGMGILCFALKRTSVFSATESTAHRAA